MDTADPRTLSGTGLLELEFPQSLAVYDKYTDAQKTVDFLSDNEFPVQNCMIVGTELKQVERITGRLTTGKVAGAGALSGIWMGVFVGLLLSIFAEGAWLGIILVSAAFGALFGLLWGLAGYWATRGRRDFSSVTAVVATKYEVLVEHKHQERAREILAQLPGALPNPFA
ncbi:MAG TPA: general stress protein [Marmoricola sp.]|jgi:hypothetical protein|nr:general stress protein [Marmoricola sp.]